MAFGIESASSSAQDQPNVFLITIDTLRADHVHCYGYNQIQTPALDGLASGGIRFTQAFTPSPITTPSHTSILTGLLPTAHGVTDFGIPLASSHITLAELLKEKGYQTAAFIGAIVLDSKSFAPGLDRGFDFYDNFPENASPASRWERVERRGMDVVAHAEQWLNDHSRGSHFVWVHLYDPHDPYEPPAPYSEMYKNHLYDGEIAYADAAVGNFLDYLKRQNWYQNAIVIVVSDHGEGLGEHRENTHGFFLYDSTTHVPLIVKLPAGQDAGKVIEAQVRTTDILSTVLDLLALQSPPKLDGQSLKPYLDGNHTIDRTSFGETDYPVRFGAAPLRSVRENGYKFIEAPRPELYFLHNDPVELKNTYEPANGTAKEFRQLIAQTWGTAWAKTSPPLPDPKDKIEEQNLLHVAMLAKEDGQETDERNALQKLLDTNPLSGEALRQIGELELRAGEYPKAAAHLKHAYEISPQDAGIAFLEGQALQKTGDLSGARNALETSLKIAPDQIPARLLLGEIYLKLNNTAAASDQFEAVLLSQPENIDAQLGAAQVLIAKRNFKEAIQQLEPLTKTQPSNAGLFELLAQALNGTGRKQDAQRAAKQAESLRKEAAK